MQIGDMIRPNLYYLREKGGKKGRGRAVTRRDKISSPVVVDEAEEELEEPEAASDEPADDVVEEPVAEAGDPSAEAAGESVEPEQPAEDTPTAREETS